MARLDFVSAMGLAERRERVTIRSDLRKLHQQLLNDKDFAAKGNSYNSLMFIALNPIIVFVQSLLLLMLTIMKNYNPMIEIQNLFFPWDGKSMN